MRGVRLTLCGGYLTKAKRKMRLKNKVGAGCSEPLHSTATTANKDPGKPWQGESSCAWIDEIGKPRYKPKNLARGKFIQSYC
jgi:hypothetical protein